MKVYMGGLIYLTGCGGDVHAYAPYGPGHHASLWVDAEALNEDQTTWWPELRRAPRTVGHAEVIEFVIPRPAVVAFPGAGQTDCRDIEDALPKLKKKKRRTGPLDEAEEEFHVDPDNAQTNAVVALQGGFLTAGRAGNFGLIEWTITDAGVAIVVARGNDSGTITLNDDDEAVMFLNSHALPEGHGERDLLRGEHVGLFRNLNPEPDMNVYAVAAKEPGRVRQFASSWPPGMFVVNSGCTCGNGTPCCC